MYYYRATIQYDGTDFCGFQWQQGIPTVQKSFNDALATIATARFTTMGSSRTDSGVHAIKQILKVSSIAPIEITGVVNELNLILPKTIKCLDFSSCAGDYRPASDHQGKVYRYYFTNQKHLPASSLRYLANISNQLDMEAIKACIEKLQGIHDFKHFCSMGSNVKSTIREIYTCDLATVDSHSIFPPDSLFQMPQDLVSCYQLQISGNGFLKQMIRHIVSALWIVGSGKMTEEEFSNLLTGQEIVKRRWKVAPASGLFLFDIKEL